MSTCENCGAHNIVCIDMTLHGGPVRFAHCRRCEHRWWADAEVGRNLALPQVLTKAAKTSKAA